MDIDNASDRRILPGTRVYIVGADYRVDSPARLIASGILERYVPFEKNQKGEQVIGAVVHITPSTEIPYERLLLAQEGHVSIWEDQCLVMLYGILPRRFIEYFSLSRSFPRIRRLFVTQYALLMTSCVLEDLDAIQVLARYKVQRDNGILTADQYDTQRKAFLAQKGKEQRIHNEAQHHLDSVSHILHSFANQTWGEADVWNWSIKPTYVNYEANVFNYKWLGSITKQGYAKHGDSINGDRLSVILEEDGEYRFRVMAFQDYGYQHQDFATYLCLTEISTSAGLKPTELADCIAQLHDSLTSNPLTLNKHGIERPELDHRNLTGNGLEIRTRVLAKHT